MDKNIGKNISKDLSGNIARNCLIRLKNLQQMHLKLLQKEYFKKIAEATGDLIGNKIARVSKNSQQNNLETVRQ